MRRLILLVALLGLLAAGCGGGASNLDGTSWDFFAYEITTDQEPVPVVAGTNPTIAFAGDQVSGNDGCNDFTGTYEVSAGNMITIGPLASTQRACDGEVMAQADVILSIISDAFLFEKTTDDQLFIRTENAWFAGYNEQADE